MAAPSVSNWQAQILQGLGAPVTPSNLKFFNAWERAEGGTASNNPFNTTQAAPGASSYNKVGVRNYLSPEQGINATISTLQNGRYGDIVSALRQGTNATLAAQALAASPWGTGNLVLKVLGSPQGASGGLPGVSPQSSSGLNPNLLGILNQGNQMFGLPQLPSSLLSSAPSRQQTLLGQPIQGSVASPSRAPAPPSVKGKRAVNLASHLLGIPYVWGGESLKGFDCSGLLQYVWAKQGVSIPRTTYDQFTQGKAVAANQLQPGDAVFFKGSDSQVRNGQVLPGHVGIYLGAGKFIEAPHTGANVRISTLAGRTDFMGARRF